MGFCWCLHCSKCSKCQMADSHSATLRNSNSALPLQSPMGREKEHRKCLLILRISGDRKNMFNKALRCFTEQNKKPFRFCFHMPLRGGGQEGKQRGKCLHTSWSVFCTHTACFLRQLWAGYHKVNHCYLDSIKSIPLNKLDIAAGGCTSPWLLPPRFNRIHLW